MTEWRECAICKGTGVHWHHIFYGRQFRSISTKYKLLISLCNDCHSRIHKDVKLKKYWQVRAERGFIEKYGQDLWDAEFGRSFDF